MDPSTPIEETMECLKQLVQEGKIRYVGLSECTPSELRRAHAIHPVTAIQMEYSLQTRDIEAEVIPTARELGGFTHVLFGDGDGSTSSSGLCVSFDSPHHLFRIVSRAHRSRFHDSVVPEVEIPSIVSIDRIFVD